MKKKILLAGLVVFSSVSLFSCKKEDATSKIKQENVAVAAKRDAAATKVPVIAFDKQEHDFGTIKQGTSVETVFTFKNTGDAPLIITDAKSSCGCTVPKKPEKPVLPGQTGEILVKYNGSGKNQVTKAITITSNTAKGSEVVRIKAFVEPKEPTSAAPKAPAIK